MDEVTRLHYLEAMGITVWEVRHPTVNPASALLSTQAMSNNITPSNLTSSRVTTDSLIVHKPETTIHINHSLWTTLQQQVSACKKCTLSQTRHQTVFGAGNHQADWLLIGEAPGQQEDLQGEPFVGNAGQLLTEMLRAIGLKREQVYIANMIKCRPPNNRDPLAEEIDACHDYLQQQIDLVKPKIILAVGKVAAQNLLNSKQSLASLRGKKYYLANIPLIVIPHPAYLLRSLLEKAKAWEDLQLAVSVYQELEQHYVETT